MKAGIELTGSWRDHDTYTAFEPSIYPCATRIDNYDGSVSGGHDDCEWDKTAVQDYLGSGPTMLILYNQIEFDEREYEKNPLVKKSLLHSHQLSSSTAAYTETFVKKYEV